MGVVVPIGRHREFRRQERNSVNAVLRNARAAGLSEVLVIGTDRHGALHLRGSPNDPGNALWLMETAKARLLSGSED